MELQFTESLGASGALPYLYVYARVGNEHIYACAVSQLQINIVGCLAKTQNREVGHKPYVE